MTTRWFSLILPVFLSLFACGGSQQPLPRDEPDLIAVLKNRPSLTQFTAALEATGVASTLQGGGSFTIFAPTDVAVAKSDAASLDDATIKHHILPERITFSDLAGENTSYTTLHTDEIEVDATESIRIGDGLMVESDITATNGVIHVIDTVLTPGDVPTDLAPAALPNPDATTEPVVPTAPSQ